MDRNSVLGLLLIAAILIGYSVWVSPSQEEIEANRRRQDSVAAFHQGEDRAKQQQVLTEKEAQAVTETFSAGDSATVLPDSVKNIRLQNQFGPFAGAAEGSKEYFIIENDLLKLTISSKGGRVVTAELKEYRTHDSLPLLLFKEDSSAFALNFFAGNKNISTEDLYFVPSGNTFSISGDDSASFAMRLHAGENQYIEYNYGLKGNSYMIDIDVNFIGIDEVLEANTRDLSLDWKIKAPSHEKSLENERINTTIYYKYKEDEVDYLSETSDEKKALEAKTKWVAFKQQFFSAVIIADDAFEKSNAEIETSTANVSENYVKDLSASLSIPYNHTKNESFGMNFYFGPNHYQTLKAFDLELEKLIPLGWGIFGWVNRFCVIPVFNFLEGFNMNFGIIILILTLIIKIVLSPLTYKAYLSTAKMKVLKPEIDELNKKYAKDEPLKKQQAVMALYKRAGVSPFGGCLPMLLQFPILIAMFRFFPASIELRQEAFLWADDLSTYDSIMNLPFNIPFYGDHVSLFTILMTISTILYTRMNSQFSTSPEMAQMKWMMYLMPIIFLGVFNNYSAGLSYYYFLANMITFLQQFLMQRFVDQDALLRKIEEHKKRPVSTKKSAFQQRLEDAAKKRGYKMPKK